MSVELMSPPTSPLRQVDSRVESPLDAHVVVLLNFIPPHQLPVLTELARRVRRLTVLISTPMEPNRSWNAHWGDLNVEVQRTLTWRTPWRHPAGFVDENFIHVPWDTFSRLRALAPDVIVSGQLGMRSVFSTLYARLWQHRPVVLWCSLSERTESGYGRTRRWLRRWLLRHGDSVVVNGRSGQRYLESLGVDRSRVFLCPYSATENFFATGTATRAPEAAHRLLYFGQFIDRKGLLPFFHALRTWGERHPTQSVDFDLFGGGPLQTQLAEFAMPANVRVHFRGSIGYEELPDAYRRGGILVFPTLADEWGMVVNEGLAAGVPVLGSRYGQAVEELCVEGVNGWLFRPDVEQEMADALERALATSCDDLNTMRLAARESVSWVTPQWAADVLSDAIAAALARRKSTKSE